MAKRFVEFDAHPPGAAYAVQLRLTPALLESLLRAQEGGQGSSIKFGGGPQGNAICAGDAGFQFSVAAEPSCDLLHLPAGGGRAALLAAVRQKLMVARKMEDERTRVRARGEEAERRTHERKAQLLNGKPVGAKPAGAGATTVQRAQRTTPPPGAARTSAPPPRPRGPTPPPQQVTASMLAAPSGRPPTHPTAPQPPPIAAAAAAQPPPAAKPMHKSASTGKIGLSSKGGASASAGAGSLQPTASPLVLRAVRAALPLRLILIAILAERPMAFNVVKTVLGDAAARVKAFKQPKKEELERTIKAVAEFRAPGMYYVYHMVLQELEAVPEAAPATAGGRGRSRTPPEQQQGASLSGQSGGDAGAPGSGGTAKRKAAAAGAAAAAAGGQKARAGGKRGRLDWTDDDSDDGRAPAAQRPRQGPPTGLHRSVSEPAAALPHGSAASPPSVCVGPAGGSSSSGGLAAAAAAAGGPAVRRTSSSRGSDRADDSWIEEHADRRPEPAAPIASPEEYREREAAFTAKYELYFQLHQLIEAHKKDFEALGAAMAGAASEAERERHSAELERLHRKRGERAKRWDAAYGVLHQELSASKARMREFVQRLQSQRAAVASAPPAVPPQVCVQ
ncbi:dentin sialophospho [Micractinium conductrix]|uniref:Dentin sialophospho n=1 Tax=Micractinium conductrix TaxID=554055 RepID=A0A2P6V8N1_9CHLO|nr:dentin sialophospho [Micractinium conductrix]|eukprot:PSC70437.1 dentin sialophospho [Micractinium conductrix]